MSSSGTADHHTRTSTIVLIASIVVSIGWIIGQTINVYQLAWVGAIFEILWIPMLIGLIGLPIYAVYRLFSEKFSYRSRFFYALLIIVLTVTLVAIFR